MTKILVREPYLVVAAATHKSVLLTWGALHLHAKADGGALKVVDDDVLEKLNPPIRGQIGFRSTPYATKEVTIRLREHGRPDWRSYPADRRVNHCWIAGLSADTSYDYEVLIDGEPWGTQTLDWHLQERRWASASHYENQFRTLPDPKASPSEITFAVIGDFGVGTGNEAGLAQDLIARQLTEAVDRDNVRFVVTLGDNVYARRKLIFFSADGDEDDDWFYTFYQPYRYLLNRIQFFPSIGNHDTSEVPWEGEDDRTQLEDNFYLETRLDGEAKAGRASLRPGLFYRLDICQYLELICLDSSKRDERRHVSDPAHQPFMDMAFPSDPVRDKWRIPFFHHPIFCKGPRHSDAKELGHLPDRFRAAGVRLVLAGHEHNYQHIVHAGMHHVVSGAAAKVRSGAPNKRPPETDAAAELKVWRAENHFLLVTAKAESIVVRAIGTTGQEIAPTIVIAR